MLIEGGEKTLGEITFQISEDYNAVGYTYFAKAQGRSFRETHFGSVKGKLCNNLVTSNQRRGWHCTSLK